MPLAAFTTIDYFPLPQNLFYCFELEKMSIEVLAMEFNTGKYCVPDYLQDAEYSDLEMSYMIETAFLGCALKKIVLMNEGENKKLILGGLKKVASFNAFINHGLALIGLTQLRDLNGKKFEQLNIREQAHFKNCEMRVEIITSQMPEETKEKVMSLHNYISK
jgi:hypothetical protein